MTPVVSPPTLPTQPLVDYVVRRYGRAFDDLWNDELKRWEPTNERLSNILHCSRGRIVHWRKQGWIPFRSADEIACKVLTTHPVNVWGEAYDRAEFHPYLLLDTNTRRMCIRHVTERGVDPSAPEFIEALEDECWEALAHA